MTCVPCAKVKQASRQVGRWLATNDPRWRTIRAQQLAKEPLCRHCKAEGKTTSATVVDHIDGKAAKREDYRAENLQSLCKDHHDIKTALENGSFGRAAGVAKRAGCDSTGRPLDRSHPWNA